MRVQIRPGRTAGLSAGQSAAVAAILLLFAAAPTTGIARSGTGTTASANAASSGATVSSAVRHDVSPPLRTMGPSAPSAANLRERPLKLTGPGSSGNQGDGALQMSSGPLAGTTGGLNFAGVGQGDYGFTDFYAPPDTNGAVGATQYVQWVNVSFAVFDKTSGAIEPGFPKAGSALWAGFGGGCETNNDGDPIVQYDKLANRWIMTQFSVSTTPFLQCVAVSTTPDATGTYNRYAFAEPYFPDYPKLGVWPDGYYMSFNMFSGNSFVGGRACALDRNAMLAGTAATQVCFQLSTSYPSLLPSDLDGTTPPPSGSPAFFMDLASNSLNLWKFHVDFATPANSTFTGPTNIPVAAFRMACGGGTCISQPSTGQRLDSLGDRLMYRLAYRNFGDHASLVVDHSVTIGTSRLSTQVGVRWYEIRDPNGSPNVYQQGTYAPDGTSRWMGSIAMDQSGDIAVGYSASSTSVFPSIRYTGRLASDPLNTLQGETEIQAGAGSQLQNLSRWGDYSSMTVDPVDDCTFWYTNEYLKASGTFNWSTRIASFKFPGCGPATPTAPAITSPSTATFTIGSPATFTVVSTGSPTPSISETGTLPGGVTFTSNSDGTATLSGTPTAGSAGTFVISFTASNGVQPDATQPFTLAVDPAAQTLVVTTTSLPSGVRGTPYSAALTAANGSLPYSWQVASGTLPPSLTLSTSGVISGTPTKAGTFSFTVQVKDASGTTATAALTIRIAPH